MANYDRLRDAAGLIHLVPISCGDEGACSREGHALCDRETVSLEWINGAPGDLCPKCAGEVRALAQLRAGRA